MTTIPDSVKTVLPERPDRSTLVMYESTLSLGWRFKFLKLILTRFKPPQSAVMSPDLVVAANMLWRQVSSDALANSTAMNKPKCAEADSRQKDGKGDWHRRKGALSISDAMHLGDACKPNSGWFAIVYAAQICKNVKLYGFSGWRHQQRGGGAVDDADVGRNGTAGGGGGGAGASSSSQHNDHHHGGGGSSHRGSRGEGDDGIKYHYFDQVEGVDTVHSFSLTLEALRLLSDKYPFLTLHG